MTEEQRPQEPNLPPPQQVPPAQVPPPPSAQPPRRGWGRWVLIGGGGCLLLLLLVFVGFAGCLAAFSGGGGGESGSGELSREEIKKRAVPIGDPVKAGDLTWTVTSATQGTELREFGERRTGNFVVVDLTVKNNGDEAVTVDSESLAILDDQGRTHEADIEAYVPSRLDLFLKQVNPGVTQQARVVFNIAPDASGLILRLGDGDPFTDTNGYVNLGI
jgi:hypothetical protein